MIACWSLDFRVGWGHWVVFVVAGIADLCIKEEQNEKNGRVKQEDGEGVCPLLLFPCLFSPPNPPPPLYTPAIQTIRGQDTSLLRFMRAFLRMNTCPTPTLFDIIRDVT